MFDLLQEYIAQHHQLSLPGIGSIVLDAKPARADFSEKLFYPPAQEWKLLSAEDGNDESLVNFIARKLNISAVEAKQSLQQFCAGLQKDISSRKEILFAGVGILKQDDNGGMQLDTVVADTILLKPVLAERVIRKNEAHTLLVGDKEKTNVEMNEWLNTSDAVNERKWWAWAAAIFVFAMGLILYNYSANNWTVKATGNQQNVGR